MGIYFSADLHFFHANIIKYCNRPFKTVEEMNEKLVEYWNETVAPEDTVYYLGDFSLAKRPVELFLPRLNGTKRLICGNHDLCHPIHGDKAINKYHKLYLDYGFEYIACSLMLEIVGQQVLLCHFPYLAQEDLGYAAEDYKRRSVPKYDKYRPIDEGKWLLHGHTHGKWKVKGRMIDCGIDIWDYRPVSLTQIEEIIRSHDEKPQKLS